MRLEKSGSLVLYLEHLFGRNVFEGHDIVAILPSTEAHLLAAHFVDDSLAPISQLALEEDKLVHLEGK